MFFGSLTHISRDMGFLNQRSSLLNILQLACQVRTPAEEVVDEMESTLKEASRKAPGSNAKGKESCTRFQRLSTNGVESIVRCMPQTGRTHQVINSLMATCTVNFHVKDYGALVLSAIDRMHLTYRFKLLLYIKYFNFCCH